MKHWIGVITNAAGSGYGVILYAQAATTAITAAPEAAMPTSLIGGFLAISLGMATTMGWVIKRLFDDLRDSREKFATTLENVEKSADQRADKLVTAVTNDGKENREQIRRETEQQALLSDRHREQLTKQYDTQSELLKEILRELQRGKP